MAEVLDKRADGPICNSNRIDVLLHLANCVPHRTIEHVQLRVPVGLLVVRRVSRGGEGKNEEWVRALTRPNDSLDNCLVGR